MGHQINGQLEAGLILEKIAPLMENEKIRKHGYNLKNSMIILSRRGVRLMATGCDIMVASYVLNPSKRSHVLNEIARDHLNIEIASMADLTGTGAKGSARNLCPGQSYGLLLPESRYHSEIGPQS